MDPRRRRFLKTAAATGAGIGAAAGAAVLSEGRPQAEWDRRSAAPFEAVSIRVRLGDAPAGTRGRLRVLLRDAVRNEPEREVAAWDLTLEAAERSVPFLLPYPYEGLVDASLRYTVALVVDGLGERRSADLRVDVRRFRFGA